MINQGGLREHWTRSSLQRTVASKGFFWATGIEDTFVAEPHAKTQRVLDEYQLTDHYRRWEQDLELMPSLQVKAARYGLPWYVISPSPGVWNWEFADKTIDKLLEMGINPIVDLIHYGTPTWMERSFLNPDYPAYAAEYAAKVAERFKGRVYWYTPLNEPRINAYYCGKLGFWPPHARGWRGFLQVLMNICKGIVLTNRSLQEVDSEIVKCHVDATDLYVSSDPGIEEDTQRRQEIVFLALDLVQGKFNSSSLLYKWVKSNGVSDQDLSWFESNHCRPDVIGINLYPMFSLKKMSRSGTRTRISMPYAADQNLVERLGTMYWDRYGIPLMVSETASAGSTAKRKRWLDESVQGCKYLIAQDIPMIGYTWWPMFSLVAWSYLGADSDLSKHVVHMGLWDLDGQLDRCPTSLVESFSSLATSDALPALFGGNAYFS